MGLFEVNKKMRNARFDPFFKKMRNARFDPFFSQKPKKGMQNEGPWAPFFDPKHTVGNIATVKDDAGNVLQRLFSRNPVSSP